MKKKQIMNILHQILVSISKICINFEKLKFPICTIKD